MEKLTRNLGEKKILERVVKNIPQPFQDPATVGQTLGSLVVVGEEEIVEESDGEPDQVGAEEEELASDEFHPPGTRNSKYYEDSS